MEKYGKLDGIIQSNSSGKLYINSEDFFKHPKIKHMVSTLMESSIFKKIEKEKGVR